MAVQEPTLTYTNPETKKPFTREEFVAFAGELPGSGHHLLEHATSLAAS